MDTQTLTKEEEEEKALQTRIALVEKAYEAIEARLKTLEGGEWTVPEDRVPTPEIEKVITHVSGAVEDCGIAEYKLKTAPSNYYDWTLEQRMMYLKAPSIQTLCKSLLVENTRHAGGPEDKLYSKFYIIIVQYTESYKPNKMLQFMRSLKNNTIGRKKYKLHFAKPEDSLRLSGYGHNAVTPFGMNVDVPVVLSHKVAELEHFWLGGGHVDLKLWLNTKEYIEKCKPFVADVTDDSE